MKTMKGSISPLFWFALSFPAFAGQVSIALFSIDATPPIGAPLCGGAVPPAIAVDDPLYARGIAILPEGQDPIVLCAVDWVGIANGGHDAWREALAQAAQTPIDRVSVHVLHQHDAPFCDYTTEELLAGQGLAGLMFDVEFSREVIARAAHALTEALKTPQPVTHAGAGQAEVKEVASNRRILGPDGKVQHVRWTATADPGVRAFPEGVIDPNLKALSFWNKDQPLALLTYYATHPQSFYRKGRVSADFVGMARASREKAMPGVKLIHFNGAGGNIGAGKYNDGAEENRLILAGRLASAMRRAWEATQKFPITSDDIQWDTEHITLPARAEITEDPQRADLTNPHADPSHRIRAARELAWLTRCRHGRTIPLGMLTIGKARVLHMPGELFVEYQLAAQAMAPDNFVCMAAYGDYGPGYIGTCAAYQEGGYETGVYVSRTAPAVEETLISALKKLLP